MPQPTKHMVQRARALRQSSSVPERLLWGRLRAGRCGAKFRRQHPVGAYVVDFFCDAARLVIELDGRSHDESYKYDMTRQRFLEQQGLQVLRVSNDRVLADLNGVVEAIAANCEALTRPLRGHPLPQGEGQNPGLAFGLASRDDTQLAAHDRAD